MKKTTFILILLVIIFSPLSVLAIGQNTAPINITNALRGESYEKITTVFNTENKIVAVNLTAKGQIKDWAKFFLFDDAKNATGTITLSPKEKKQVKIVFSVPKNAGNGEYKGQITVVKKAEKKADDKNPYSKVDQSVDRPVVIKVTDKEDTRFDVQVIPNKFDVKSQENLIIRVIYDNQGNTTIRPEVSVDIKNGMNESVYSVIYPYPEDLDPIKALSIFESKSITIPSATFEKGKYRAYLAFSQNKIEKAKKEIQFSAGLFDDKKVSVLGASLANDILNIANIALAISAVFIIIATFFIFKYMRAKKEVQANDKFKIFL
jgi:uncharacterized membrane protein